MGIPYYATSDELRHYGVLGMRWGIRRSKEVKGVKANKRKYKGNKEAYQKDMKKARIDAANRLYSKNSKKTNAEIASWTRGESAARVMLLGSYGTMKYTQAKNRGTDTGKAVVEALLYNWGNNMTGSVLSGLEYLDNRAARK